MRGPNWTKEQEQELLRLEAEGKSREFIAEHFGRTKNSIDSKLNKLHISRGDRKPEVGKVWTKEQLEELSRMVDQKVSLKDLAEHFGRTETAIEVKVNRIGKQIIRPGRIWTEQEKEMLSRDWLDGSLSMNQLINKYNRPSLSLRKQALLLDLGPRAYNEEYVSIPDICREMQVSHDRVSNWLKKGLKSKKNRSGKVRYLIDVDDLLKFLENNQDMFDASKVSDYLFWNEPKWLKDKRKRDIKINTDKNRVPWTNEEDKRLEMMFCRGKSDEEIAKDLKRTPCGVLYRRMMLGYVKNRYMDYEIEILKENSRYKTVAELCKMLPLRSYKGIISKCEQLGLKYHVSKEKCEVKNDEA